MNFTIRDRFVSNLFWFLERSFGEKRLSGILQKKKETFRSLMLKKMEIQGDGKEIAVERIVGLDSRTFQSKFVTGVKPVILSGFAKDWQCCREWSFDYFFEKFADEVCGVTEYSENDDITLSQFIESMRKGVEGRSHFSRVVQNNKELLSQIDFSDFDKFLGWQTHVTSYQFFLGPQGAITPLHAGGTNNFSVQICGKKTWRLIDTRNNPVIHPQITRGPLFSSHLDPLADVETWPENKFLKVYRADLEPGDVLYIPTFFWHHVQYTTDSIAAGLRWFSPQTAMRSSAMMSFLLATSTQPSFVSYYLANKFGKMAPFYGSKKKV